VIRETVNRIDALAAHLDGGSAQVFALAEAVGEIESVVATFVRSPIRPVCSPSTKRSRPRGQGALLHFPCGPLALVYLEVMAREAISCRPLQAAVFSPFPNMHEHLWPDPGADRVVSCEIAFAQVASCP
jgi:hypothetical protein